MKVRLIKHELVFRFPAGTSRGVLKTKPAWFLLFEDKNNTGTGEISRLPGLSFDDKPEFEEKLNSVIRDFNKEKPVYQILDTLIKWPSLHFAVETGLLDLNSENHIHVRNSFTRGETGIPINGLIWMGDKNWMTRQIDEKLDKGFRCLKMKIGAIDIQTELDILSAIRQRYNSKDLELRVDANGAFKEENVMPILNKLAQLNIHSIEQPVKAGQAELMGRICAKTPLPVALDEELIGVFDRNIQEELLTFISPQYIILKPGLLGGFEMCDTWMNIADSLGTDYWITSSLESNIGLSAIAQWTSALNITMHQGLGTGSLYENNFISPLLIKNDKLWFDPDQSPQITL